MDKIKRVDIQDSAGNSVATNVPFGIDAQHIDWSSSLITALISAMDDNLKNQVLQSSKLMKGEGSDDTEATLATQAADNETTTSSSGVVSSTLPILLFDLYQDLCLLYYQLGDIATNVDMSSKLKSLLDRIDSVDDNGKIIFTQGTILANVGFSQDDTTTST